MHELKLKWKNRTDSDGEALYLNRLRIASYSYNITREKGNVGDIYKGVVLLPTLSPNSYITAPNHEQMRKQIEKIVTDWFNEALN